MARQGKGILSGFTGSISNITGQNQKGISTIRKKGGQPKNTRTAAQETSSVNFALAQNLYKAMTDDFYKEFFQAINKQKTTHNNFISRILTSNYPENQKNVTGNFYGGEIYSDYFNLTGQFTPGNKAWNVFLRSTILGKKPNPDDYVLVMIMNITQGTMKTLTTGPSVTFETFGGGMLIAKQWEGDFVVHVAGVVNKNMKSKLMCKMSAGIVTA